MSLMLTFYPLSGPQDLRVDEIFCRDQLSIYSDDEIEKQIPHGSAHPTSEVQTMPLPRDLWIVHREDSGVIKRRTDPFGAPLTYAFASTLKKLKLDPRMRTHRPVKAWIDALPDDVPVILYWN